MSLNAQAQQQQQRPQDGHAGASEDQVELARQSVDEFVQQWETFTAPWDKERYVCELCQTGARRDATLFCDTGKYLLGQYNDTFWVCDTCLPDREAPGFNQSLVFRRIERDRPHVWSGSTHNNYRNGFLDSAPVPDESFRLPAGVGADRADPSVLARLTPSWFGPHGPWAAFVGINLASAPSLRAWLPLCGGLVLGPGGRSFDVGGHSDHAERALTREDTVLVPLVCCDSANTVWGSVIVAEFFLDNSMSRWTRIAGSFDALARGSAADPIKRFWHARITGDHETANTVPTPRPVPFNQTNLASIITGTDMYAAITGAPRRPGYPY